MDINALVEIQQMVESVFNPPKGWIIEPTKKQSVVFPRQIAHWAAYYYTNNLTSMISFYFGKRNHEIVNHSVGIVNGLICSDYTFSCKIRALMFLLEQSGYKNLSPKGRRSIKQNKNLIFPVKFKQKPKPIIVLSEAPPRRMTQREKLIQKHNLFLKKQEQERHLRLQMRSNRMATTNIDNVIETKRTIEDLKQQIELFSVL